MGHDLLGLVSFGCEFGLVLCVLTTGGSSGQLDIILAGLGPWTFAVLVGLVLV